MIDIDDDLIMRVLKFTYERHMSSLDCHRNSPLHRVASMFPDVFEITIEDGTMFVLVKDKDRLHDMMTVMML